MYVLKESEREYYNVCVRQTNKRKYRNKRNNTHCMLLLIPSPNHVCLLP